MKLPYELDEWYQNGEVFAYPTEAVFGLGCDPLNKQAVEKILKLKNRRVEKGMILIASDFAQLEPYILFDLVPEASKHSILESWPGPITWLMPKSDHTPYWISGDSDFVAVRVSSHPLVREICGHLSQAIVSTSANPAGQAPALNEREVITYFGEQVFVVEGELGSQCSPSKIFNSLTMETIRE